MSRNSKRKRNKLSEKRRGRPKTVAGKLRRSIKRKRCRSNKKLVRRLKRTRCTICINTTHGKREVLACRHVFHKKRVQQLKNHTGKCPNCRQDIPANTGSQQRSNPEVRPGSLILRIPREVVLQAGGLLPSPFQNLDNLSVDLDVISPTSENLDVNVEDLSSDLDNPSIDPSDSSPNFDYPSTESTDPSPDLDIPSRELPRASPNLNNPGLESPDLFVSVLCCRCQHDSNIQPEQGHQRFNSEIRPDSSASPRTLMLHTVRQELLRVRANLVPIFDNLNTNLDDRSSDLVNSSIDLVDLTPNFDNPSTDSTEPSPDLEISVRELPRPSP